MTFLYQPFESLPAQEHLWHLAGWTMVHFLWMGLALFAVGWAARRVLRRTSPTVRYTTSLATLALLAALPFAITAYIAPPSWRGMSGPSWRGTNDASARGIEIQTPAQATDWREQPTAPITESPEFIELAVTPHPVDIPAPQPQLQILPHPEGASRVPLQTLPRQDGGAIYGLSYVVAYLPWLWLVGAPLTFLLLATGLIGTERLRRSGTILTDGPLRDTLNRLQQSLGVTRRVGIAISERVATPILVGIVKPLILLPPSAVTGWTVEELEMVLTHELAHVGRWDNLVNFGQRVVESLLFFHPAVWIVSRWVRSDREECCDAVVVRHTDNPEAYVHLLVELASAKPVAGLAMAQHPLTSRIRRILKLEEEPMRVSRNAVLLLGTMLMSLVVGLTLISTQPTTAEEAEGLASQPTEEGTQDVAADESTEEVEATADSPFPTFEEQKILTRAYNLLGMESEKITDEELKIVQSEGHQGALRVTNHVAGGDLVVNRILMLGLIPGDLLVGLHSWPTTSFADLDQILSRDDLDQLAPLKFYAIRPGRHPDGDGEITDIMIFSGRLRLNIDAWREVLGEDAREPATALSEQLKQVQQERDALAKQLQQIRSQEETKGTDDPPRVSTPYGGGPSEKQGTVPWYMPQAQPQQSFDEPALQEQYLTPPIMVPEQRVQTPDPEQRDRPRTTWHIPPVADYPGKPEGHPELRYEGQSFEEWRQVGRTELSDHIQLSVVQAMGAFARAGRGKEVAEFAMEVAPHNRWSKVLRGDPVARGTMANWLLVFANAIPADIAVETVLEAADSENAEVRAFAEVAAARLAAKHEETEATLREKFPDLKKFEEPSPRSGRF